LKDICTQLFYRYKNALKLNQLICFTVINYCLDSLIENSLVKIHNFSQNQNKLGYAQMLTPCSISKMAVEIETSLKRKLQKYEASKRKIKALKLQSETENSQKPINT
jgi:hypothetical protein